MELNVNNLAIMLRTVRTSLLFDENWYKTTYQIKHMDGALHYLLIGFNEGNDPSPFFSTSKYFACFPDVKVAGMNPLVHYEIYGLQEKKYRGFVDMTDLREHYPELLSDMQDGLLRLRVTNACNAKCRYCGVRLFFGEEKNHQMDRKWLFETCRPLYSKIRYLLLTGGDPNITPHSYDFMKFITEEYPHITIYNETNGIAFDKKFQKLFAENYHKVHVSINSSNADLYAKSCWEGTGGEVAYKKFMVNLIDYVELLAERDQLCFGPDVSMVINHDNYFDVAEFVKLALQLHATMITFFFDYTENNMANPYFTQPNLMRPALKTMMEIEKVLADRVFMNFRLWVPVKELELIEEQVNNESDADLCEKYHEIDELAKGRSIVDEHKQRNALRRKAGKAELNFDEDHSSTIRLETRMGRDICWAPWKELDIYPDGRIDFCGWYEPTQNLNYFFSENGYLDWDEVINSYEYMRGRKRILQHEYDECQTCCPMNDVANPIVDLYKYSCPSAREMYRKK